MATLVDLETLTFTSLNDLKRQLVYCEIGSSVRLTMVVEDGRLLTVDGAAIKREARELAAEMAAESGEARAAAEELLPYYREMYRRAAVRDVGFNRWAT